VSPSFATSVLDNRWGAQSYIFVVWLNLMLVRYAYIEFKDEDAVTNAVLLDKTEFKGRNLKVIVVFLHSF